MREQRGYSPEIGAEFDAQSEINKLADMKHGKMELMSKQGVPFIIEHSFNETGSGRLETWTVSEGLIPVYSGPDRNSFEIKNNHLFVMGVDKGEIGQMGTAQEELAEAA